MNRGVGTARRVSTAGGAAALMVAALLIGACGADDTAQTATTATTARTTSSTTTSPPTTTSTEATTTTTVFVPAGPGYGGEAIIGQDQEPPTLNPYAPGGDNFIVRLIGQAIHVGVLDIDGHTLELIPELVTEVPSIDNGGLTVGPDGTMTVRYLIRDEARWADGVPISGYDLEFTYELLTDPEIGAERWFRDNPGLIVPESVVAGDKTFEYTLKRPTVEWEWLFQFVVPRHQVEGSDFLGDWNSEPWLSGGPFVFGSWQRGHSVRVVRNENYWKSDPATGLQLPYLDEVVFRFIPETFALVDAFRNRQVDVINPPPHIPSISDLAETEGVEFTVLPGPIWEHFNFQFGPNNRNPESWNEHVLFRRAVAHGLDLAAICEAVHNCIGDVLESYVEAFTPGWSTGAWARYDHDPQKARNLLTELCLELQRDCAMDPPRLVFSTTSNGDARVVYSRLVEENLEAVGIEVDLDLEDSSIFFGETLDYGTWDMGAWAWVGTPGLAGLIAIHDVFDPDGPPPDGQNFYRWGTPAVSGADPEEFDLGPSRVRDQHTERFAEIRDAMNQTVDQDEILALVRQAEEILADQVVIIPIYSRLDIGAVWADEIGGYVHNPSLAGDTWNVECWYRTDR